MTAERSRFHLLTRILGAVVLSAAFLGPVIVAPTAVCADDIEKHVEALVGAVQKRVTELEAELKARDAKIAELEAKLAKLVAGGAEEAEKADPDAKKEPVVLGVLLNEKLVVEEVDTGFAASAAGLKQGDRIVAFNGTEVKDLDVLGNQVGELSAGDKFSLTFLRGDKKETRSVIGSSRQGEAKLVSEDAGAAKADAKADEEKKPAFLGIDVVEEGGGVKIVAIVDGSAAKAAGLQVDDVVKKANGKDVSGSEALKGIVAALAAGDAIDLVVSRGGSDVEVKGIALGAEGVAVAEKPEPPKPGALGIVVELNQASGHIFVKIVAPNSAAEAAQVRAGDVLITADGKNVKSFDDLDGVLRGRFAGEKVTLRVKRGTDEKEIEIELGEA
jgi:S1-C subfamily serine protease